MLIIKQFFVSYKQICMNGPFFAQTAFRAKCAQHKTGDRFSSVPGFFRDDPN